MSTKGEINREKKPSMRNNFVYNITYEVVRIILPLITTPYVSRILGSSGIGTYTLAHTYAEYFILFAGLGFSTYGARELAYVRDDKDKFKNTFWEIFIARTSLLSVATVIYFIYFFIVSPSSDLSYRICIIYLVSQLFDISYYFKAIEKFKTVVIRNILIKAVSLVLIFIVVKQSSDVWKYTMILASAELLGQFVMIFSVDRNVFGRPRIDRKNLLRHFKVSFQLFIPTIAIQLYTMLDKVMLGWICTESDVGFYENAQKMVRLAAAVASAMVSVATPRTSYDFARGAIDSFVNTFKRVIGMATFLAFPMCFGLIGIASNFSSWYYGSGFDGIDFLVRVGAVLIISLAWSGIFGNMLLIATNNQKYYTIAVYISAVINIIMNALLMPAIGAMGALIASVVAEVVGMLIMFYFSNRLFNIAKYMPNVVKYLICSVVMLIAVLIVDHYLPYSIGSTIVEITIGCVVYFSLMLLLKDENFLECVNYAKKILLRRTR